MEIPISDHIYWLTFVPVTIEGYVNIYARDITERKKAEQALRESNEELNRFNRVAVGRELRIIELKKEVNDLCGLTGRPSRYPLDFEKENDNEKDETRST